MTIEIGTDVIAISLLEKRELKKNLSCVHINATNGISYSLDNTAYVDDFIIECSSDEIAKSIIKNLDK